MNEPASSYDRFRYFWWTLGIFAVFGVAALVFALLSGEPNDIDSYDDSRRIAKRKEVDQEQAKVFEGVKPSDVFEMTGRDLLAGEPRPAPTPAAPADGAADATAPATPEATEPKQN